MRDLRSSPPPGNLCPTRSSHPYNEGLMSTASDRNRDNAPLGKKLKDLYDLIEGIEIAMFTTRRPDGQLVCRPMATQTQAEGTDLWFVTDIESNKLDELESDPNVNLAYYKDRTREWVSVSGTATISQDRQAIRELYQRDWKAWFGDQGGEKDGGPEDPRLALILVDVQSVVYLKVESLLRSYSSRWPKEC